MIQSLYYYTLYAYTIYTYAGSHEVIHPMDALKYTPKKNTSYPSIIDSHFHIHEMEKKGLDVFSILTECFKNGLHAALDIGIEADDIQARRKLAGSFPNIYHSLGLSPSESSKFPLVPAESAGNGSLSNGAVNNTLSELIERLEDDIRTYEPVALGEIGLDWYRNYGTPDHQKLLFRSQIEAANRHGLPIIVHNRDADEDVMRIFSETPPEYGGIMHCYSSDYFNAKRFLDIGLFISFAGNVTFKKAEHIRETAERIPSDRLLIETDAPYLSPMPKRGKPNHPGLIIHTYEFIASLRGTELKSLIEQTRSNFYTVLQLSRKEINNLRGESGDCKKNDFNSTGHVTCI